MKFLIIILLAVSCGRHEPLGYMYRDITKLSEIDNRIDDTNKDLKGTQADVEEIKKQIADIYSKLNSDSGQINSLQLVINQMQAQIDQNKKDLLAIDDLTEDEFDIIYQKIQDSESNINIINNIISGIENNITLNEIRIAELESNENITDIIDPCGDKVNAFDEVILKTSSGKLIAFFESGSKRFLSILTDGNYQTTDAQKCNFSVSNGEIL